jgi:hypothetical protein
MGNKLNIKTHLEGLLPLLSLEEQTFEIPQIKYLSAFFCLSQKQYIQKALIIFRF